MNKKLLVLLVFTMVFLGCQEIKQQTDAMKKEVGTQVGNAYNTAEDLKNKAVETKENIDNRVKQVEDAAKAVSEAAQKAEEAKKAVEKVSQ